eukprot:Skav202912  [mRNA]  locus=scaffold1565:68869:69168:- [translate_table: standard]
MHWLFEPNLLPKAVAKSDQLRSQDWSPRFLAPAEGFPAAAPVAWQKLAPTSGVRPPAVLDVLSGLMSRLKAGELPQALQELQVHLVLQLVLQLVLELAE